MSVNMYDAVIRMKSILRIKDDVFIVL